jgi:hypothetical protein
VKLEFQKGARMASAVPESKIAPGQNRWMSGPVKILRRAGAAFLVVFLLAVFAASTYFKNDLKNEQYVKSYEVWGVFHYYLGAKYFSEVGYFNLYTCALEADQEGAGYWYWITEARDMETYRIVPRASLPPCPRTNFTTARWSEFSQDVEYFALLGPPSYFASMFTDKGFNPPPLWVAIAKPMAQAVPISKTHLAEIVFNLDIPAVLIGVLIIWRSRGGIAALLTAVLVVFYFGNFGRIGGNYLQYLWFPLVVGALILWAKSRPGFSGAVLGVAVGLQIFPLFVGLPIVVRGIVEFIRGRKKAEWIPYFRFSSALIAVILASFLFGSLAGRGVGAWGEWQKKISIHKNYLQGEIFDIGLANLTAAVVSTNHNEGTNYVNDVPNTLMRLHSLESNIWFYRALCAVFLAVWLFTVVGAPAGDLFGHGCLIMYTTASSSPYYYLLLALVPLVFWKSGRIVRLYATCATVTLFAAHIIIFRGQYVSGRYLPHLLSECSIALFLLGLAVISVFSNRLARQSPILEQ